MRLPGFLCVLLFGLPVLAQGDEHIEALIRQYGEERSLKCEILVQVDVEGMQIPDKRIYVEFEKDQKPKVKGEGLSLLPKKGTVDQFRQLLTSPMQAIFLSRKGGNMIYKLVALDPESDWITADIIFDEERHLIYESTVSTKKFGTFHALHSYDGRIYPSRSVVTFDVKRFSLPLKFIGREHAVEDKGSDRENVQGRVTMEYTYL